MWPINPSTKRNGNSAFPRKTQVLTRLLNGQRRSAKNPSLHRLHEQQGKQPAVVVETLPGHAIPAAEGIAAAQGKLESSRDASVDSSALLDAWAESGQGLRHHPRVLLSLQAWWECACELCGGAAEIDEGQYMSIFKKVYRGMVAEYDEEEAVSSVMADWEHDSCGQRSLTRQMFFDCVFELADVWSKESKVDEYVGFMDTLLPQIARGGQFVADAKIDPGSGNSEDVEDEPEPEPEPKPQPEPVVVPVAPAPPRSSPSPVKPSPTVARPFALPPPRPPPPKPSAAPHKRELQQAMSVRLPVAPVTLDALKRERAIETI